MIIFMGLANIGEKGTDTRYTNTRHSVGEQLVRYCVKHFHVNIEHVKQPILLWKTTSSTILQDSASQNTQSRGFHKFHGDHLHANHLHGKHVVTDDNALSKNVPSTDVPSNDVPSTDVLFAVPKSYMNTSGIAISNFMHCYKYPVSSLWVIHDDLDLPFGKIKIKQGGSHAGHNGLKSIDQHLGNAYFRIRVGIDHPRNLLPPQTPLHPNFVTAHVLGKWFPKEEDHLNLLFKKITEALPYLLTQPSQIESFMNRVYQ